MTSADLDDQFSPSERAKSRPEVWARELMEHKARLRPYRDSELGLVMVQADRSPVWPYFLAAFLIVLLSGIAVSAGIIAHTMRPNPPTHPEVAP